MRITRIYIQNFRNFGRIDIPITSSVTTILGENNTGKTNLLHALRLAIDAGMSSRRRQLTVDDFPAGTKINIPQQVLVAVEFEEFAGAANQEAALAPCQFEDDKARITFRFRPSGQCREALASEERNADSLTLDDYRFEIRGGGDKDPSQVSWNEDYGTWVRYEELAQAFLVVLMVPLRDVEQSLKQSANSPLGRLVHAAGIEEEEQQRLTEILQKANQEISESETINQIGQAVTQGMEDAAGPAFSLKAKLGMASTSFADIARGLTVLLSNQAMQDFDPSRNGLGLNNVLYIGMLMQYFEKRAAEGKTAGELLLIEEPEAHLHPQLQRALYAAIASRGVQTIVTSHSTHISSSAPLDSVVVLTNGGKAETEGSVPSRSEGMNENRIADLERYLDATKGSLLFARRVMLVEGPAELFLIPPLIETVTGVKLDQHGISVVPIFGVHFDTYAPLFSQTAMKKKCAIIADGDLSPSDAIQSSTAGDEEASEEGVIHKPKLAELESEFVRVFTCATTFEREVTTPATLPMMIAAAVEVGAPQVAKRLHQLNDKLSQAEPGECCEDLEEAKDAVLRLAQRIGKARFAQVASKYARGIEELPPYISIALEWLLEADEP